ncbi:hypothetical protein H072_11523 [Dactylellina haptotyla CBS 200.50]|uniref:Uncharacterized protein n=1 Tax=Dactylellina haptotyla (strain CBS 200.50) TaxID=1284197 RepID=S8BIW8_DACHA|nr:hypothetical protein H072_11523 [Dactylellina haptotyla CBS 200.50]
MSAWFQSINNDASPTNRRISYAGSISSRSSNCSDDEEIEPAFLPSDQNGLNNGSHHATKSIERAKSPSMLDERTLLILRTNDEPTGNPKIVAYTDDFDVVSPMTEFLLLIKTSVPVILAYTLQSSLQALSILIVGRISPAALSVAAFCYMFAMSTAFVVALGGTTALDTLASSCFTGSKNRTDLGVLLQRAFVVLGVLYLPVSLTWWFSGPIFKALGQEDYIVQDGPKFLRWLIPGGLGYVFFESLKKYLQAQGIMRAGTYVLLITSPINVILNYLFIYTFGFGVNGAPMATSITYWLSFFLLALYCKYIAGYECWGGWSTACFKNMFTFLRLALLGTVMVGTEWWAFEIVAIVAGRLGQIPLAAQSVIMTTDQVLNTIPFGIGVAASARVGNLLGAKNARGAARAANTAAWVSMFMGTAVLIVLMAVKDFYAKIFNDDEQVIRLTSEVMPYVALFQIADGLNGSCGGSLRGMGRQHVGAGVNVVSYYLVALPLGIWLAYNGWGLAGLWVGQCLALYAVGIGEWMLVYFSDWDAQVVNALSRLDDAERTELGEGRPMEN